MKFKRSLMLLVAGLVLAGTMIPAQAQDHHRRHRHCWYRHGHRHCSVR